MTAVKKNQVIVLKRPGENSERVHLVDVLKSGGAGFVYSIKDDSSRVIKIYRPETLTSEGTTYQEKIECMLGNVPNVSKISSGDGAIVQLAWPLASAYTIRGEFVGFAMPMVDMQSTTELEYVLTHKLAEKEGLPHHLGVGVSLAHNLAAVVSSIHALGHAIVDLKPVNLKFYKKEFYVAVLDCDGFYINVPGKTASAPQVTADYLAPEFQNAPITRPEHQDMFALAVIIFKLLNFGIHPYAGVPINGAKIPSDLEEKIKTGLYPYGVVPHKKVSPAPASTHETFPTELRALFDRAFGGSPSDRPKATEWAGALKKFAEKSKGLLEYCTHQHLHFKDMHCATCLREQKIAKAAATSRAAILPSMPKNTSYSSTQSGGTNASFSSHSSKQNPSKTPLARPPWIQAAPQPQVRVASLSGSLQQGVSQPHHTQSQAPVQSAPPATQAMNINSAPIKRGAVALILVVGMLWYFADMVKTRFAGPQSVSVAAQQANTKQKSPQDAIPQPDTAPATIADTPAAQDPTPIAVQESIDSSRSESSLVAGSTVGPENEGASGTLGWLGIDAQTLPEERAPMKLDSMPRWMDINKQRGMIINVVVKGSPADIAGMVVGDLLVAVDNKAVDTDDATRNVVSNIPVGRVVPIKIIRDGREMYLLLTITQRP